MCQISDSVEYKSNPYLTVKVLGNLNFPQIQTISNTNRVKTSSKNDALVIKI